MGFTTGLLGGFTLTTTVLYLSLSYHTQQRLQQAAALRRQSLVLNDIVEPLPPPPPPVSREVQAGLWEMAKDQWNSELARNVRRLQETDWDEVRNRMEEGVSVTWRRLFRSTQEGVKVAEEKVKEGAGVVEEQVKGTIRETAAAVVR